MLTFVTQPMDTATGQILQPIKISSSLAMANVPISLSITEQLPTGAPLLGGTVTQITDSTGTATFSDLYIYGGDAKSFTLVAQAGAPT